MHSAHHVSAQRPAYLGTPQCMAQALCSGLPVPHLGYACVRLRKGWPGLEVDPVVVEQELGHLPLHALIEVVLQLRLRQLRTPCRSAVSR